MMAIQTAYQAYNELHPTEDEPNENHHGILHDFKESFKEVIHQITGKTDEEDFDDMEVLVENEVNPIAGEDEEMVPEFSKTGYINTTLKTFISKENAIQKEHPQFSESSESLPRQKPSKTVQQMISDAGDEIIQIKVVPRNENFGKLIDAGKHVEVSCEPLPQNHSN